MADLPVTGPHHRREPSLDATPIRWTGWLPSDRIVLNDDPSEPNLDAAHEAEPRGDPVRADDRGTRALVLVPRRPSVEPPLTRHEPRQSGLHRLRRSRSS